jgi:hypothetical protein
MNLLVKMQWFFQPQSFAKFSLYQLLHHIRYATHKCIRRNFTVLYVLQFRFPFGSKLWRFKGVG